MPEVRRVLMALAASSAMLAALMVTAPAPARASESLGGRILDKAETRTGDWYAYGMAGPSAFDCSGLVVWSARQLGVSLPRTTTGMLASPHLYRVYSPQRGDLAFWGPIGSPYHVGFVTIWPHAAFGALHAGTLIGWYSWAYWPPSAFYRVR